MHIETLPSFQGVQIAKLLRLLSKSIIFRSNIMTSSTNTYQADEQYTDRNKLDRAVPKRPFPKIVYGLHKFEYQCNKFPALIITI